MRNYELKIKDLNGVWHTADLGNDLPAMNYQVNDIAELKDRQADYSQQLKLPKSAVNRKIFGYSDIIEVVTEAPYRRFDCRLFLNDVVIAGIGSYLILDRVSEHFEVQILAGTKSFFRTLAERDMSDLDLGSYVLGSSWIASPYNVSNDNYVVPMATFIKSNTKSLINTPRLPFAYLYNALLKIANPYELITDVQIDDYAVSICSLKPTENSFDDLESKASGYLHNPGFKIGYMTFSISKNSSEELSTDVAVDENNTVLIYTCKYDCDFDFVLTLDCETLNSKVDVIAAFVGESIIAGEVTAVQLGYYDYERGIYVYRHIFTRRLKATKGDKLTVTVKDAHLQYYKGIWRASIDFKNISANIVPVDGTLSVSPNIGFEKQLDLFKAFVQLFGLTVFVDAIEKKIYAFTLEKVYQNKSIAKDWSKKLHNRNHFLNFRMDNYAQSNFIRFNDNDFDNVKEYGLIAVNDETLNVYRDIFMIGFESGSDYPVIFGQGMPWEAIGVNTLQNKSVANVPLWELADEVYEFSECKPHIVKVTKSQNGNEYVYHANHAVLSEIVNEYYLRFAEILNPAKMIEVEFYLTEKDIEEYRSVKDGMPGCFVPVWVEKFGAYFYINKIKNFISGKLTKVELVRL